MSSHCETCERKQRRMDRPQVGNLYSYSIFPWEPVPGLYIGRRHATVPFVYHQNPMFAACAYGNAPRQECDRQFGSFIYQFDEHEFDGVPRRFF